MMPVADSRNVRSLIAGRPEMILDRCHTTSRRAVQHSALEFPWRHFAELPKKCALPLGRAHSLKHFEQSVGSQYLVARLLHDNFFAEESLPTYEHPDVEPQLMQR